MTHAILLISCADKKGITATVTNFIYQNNGNIVHADQHIDEQTNTFFMRIEWSLDRFLLKRDQIGLEFSSLAAKFKMQWALSFSDRKPRLAVYVSKHLHCLYDLLLRHKSGQLFCDIPLVVSNHSDAQRVAQRFSIDFVEMPITKQNKRSQERRQIQILQQAGIDLVVLARYHQILTAQFIKEFPNQIINIHHSFLPAFAGRDPYAQAYKKGVKIIGATSHYVTEKLDAGPIIGQDTVRVSHRDSLDDLKRKGEDLEKIVLSRAIRLHLGKKVLSYNNKTVIFD